MARSRRQREASTTETPRQRAFPRRGLTWLAAVLTLLAVLVFGRGLYGRWCRQHAARDLDVWALSDARKWLDRADTIDWRDADTQLMRARLFRQLRDMEQRDVSLELARTYGASREAVQDEVTLGRIQTGELGVEASHEFDRLVAAGISPHDAYACYLSSAISRDNLEAAAVMLDAWDRAFPNHPHVVFHRGVLCAQSGDGEGARTAFEKTLEVEPRHDLARLALARMAESHNELVRAIDLFTPLAQAHPENGIIVPGFARALRKAGRLAQAQSVLEPLVSQLDVLSTVVVEKVFVEMERGNYRAAKSWLDRADPTVLADDETLTAATITLGMLGETAASENLVSWMFDKEAGRSLVSDLRTRAAVNPQDQETSRQLRQALDRMTDWTEVENPYELARQEAADQQRREEPGTRLYQHHCSACHGLTGDGRGHAAKYVFPRPRDLRSEPMRLITTANGVPTPDDIRTVIKSGIPGTSMVPLDALTEDELKLLVDVVLQMRREGVREQYTERLEAMGEPVDDDDVIEVVQLQTTPGQAVAVPDFGPADIQSLALGEQLYTDQACASCHGDTGTGDPTMPLFDDNGSPAFPRDVVHDVFKGGNELQAIYLRILLGMPGTPHPANATLTTSQLIALTHYCHSLGEEPKRKLTNHQRAQEAWRRPAVEW